MATVPGLVTSPKDLKAMLEKTGYNMKKLKSGSEKLDILEHMRAQLQDKLETGGTTNLKLHELTHFLQQEGMPAEGARDALLKLEALRLRERGRLGNYVGPKEYEIFCDALALIPDSNIEDILPLEPPAKKPRVESDGNVKQGENNNAAVQAVEKPEPPAVDPPQNIEGENNNAAVQAVEKPEPPAVDPPQNIDDVGGGSSSNAQAVTQPIPEETVERDILARIDPEGVKEHLSILGNVTEEQKDDLTKIRGIGPAIEARLNRIKIYRYDQLTKLTQKMKEDIASAARFFPGRIDNDLWEFQAQRLAAGKEWIIHPPVKKSGQYGLVKVDGEDYERDLVDIATHYGANGVELNDEHAECLWFSAMDGRRITDTEKKTLEYIMKTFAFSATARAFLMSKLD